MKHLQHHLHPASSTWCIYDRIPLLIPTPREPWHVTRGKRCNWQMWRHILRFGSLYGTVWHCDTLRCPVRPLLWCHWGNPLCSFSGSSLRPPEATPHLFGVTMCQPSGSHPHYTRSAGIWSTHSVILIVSFQRASCDIFCQSGLMSFARGWDAKLQGNAMKCLGPSGWGLTKIGDLDQVKWLKWWRH